MSARGKLRISDVAGAASRSGVLHSLQGRELPPDLTISYVAEIGILVGHPARTNMLVNLLQTGELTARELADCAGVSPQTTSGHLAKLLAAGLVRLDRRGRYHFYRLASVEVVRLIEALYFVGSKLRTPSDSVVATIRPELRMVRLCRGHIAGKLGVAVTRSLTALSGDESPTLTPAGRILLARWGLETEDGAAPACGCFDWSEQCLHLGGALGAKILERSLALGWLRTNGPGHQLVLTPAGLMGFQHRFGVDLS